MKSMYEYHQEVLASETERAKYNDRAIGIWNLIQKNLWHNNCRKSLTL